MNLSKEYMKGKFSIYIINYNNLWIIKFNKKKIYLQCTIIRYF